MIINLNCQNRVQIKNKLYRKERNVFDINNRYNVRDISFKGIPSGTDAIYNTKLLHLLNDKNFSELLKGIINDESNLIGKGLSGKAFSLKDIGLKDYVLKIPYDISVEDLRKPFIRLKNHFLQNSFGQTLAINSSGIKISRLVNGSPHGISSDIMMHGNQVLREDAQKFLEQLKILSSFNDSAYIDLAEKFDIINKSKRFVVDVNPNNLLVDTKKQEFNLIDLLDTNVVPHHKDFRSDVNTMISIVLDGLMHEKAYNKLAETEKTEYKKYSEIIIDKCKKAAKLVGLENSPLSMDYYFDLVMYYDGFVFKRNHSELWSKRYQKFRELYKNVLPPEQQAKTVNNYSEADIISRFLKEEQIPKFYLSFLHSMNLLNNSQIVNIIEKFPEKINRKDLEYFIENRVPLTKFDTPAIIENRINCMNAKIYDRTSLEYKENINCILKKEFSKLAKVPNDKKMIIITGIPACGKSTLIENNFACDFYVADSDIIKKSFPTYDSEGKYLNNLHDLSRNILQQDIIPEVEKEGKNIIIPTTGMSEYVERLATSAKRYGYNVELIHFRYLIEDSIKSVIRCFEKTGRFIDPYFILHRAPFIEKIPEDFKNSNLIDEITIIDRYL